eukprot:m.83953 g.83953  ORF g.83953 m.83953 type:complete len:331 (-) comp8180_c0_seq1:401-1393(-)
MAHVQDEETDWQTQPLLGQTPEEKPTLLELFIGCTATSPRTVRVFAHVRVALLLATLALPFIVYRNDIGAIEEAWYTSLLGIIAASIPAAGAPIAGGVVFIPALQLAGLGVEAAAAFSTATQMLGVGLFAPLSWLIRDRSVFIPSVLVSGTMIGAATAAGMHFIADPGPAIVEIIFACFLLVLIVTTLWGLLRGTLVSQNREFQWRPRQTATFVVLAVAGGAMTAYIAVGIDKLLFLQLTAMEHVNPTRAAVTCITVVGLVSAVNAGFNFASDKVPINYWICAIPGLLFGSMAGPVINRVCGSRAVLYAFVLLLVVDLGREIELIIEAYN